MHVNQHLHNNYNEHLHNASTSYVLIIIGICMKTFKKKTNAVFSIYVRVKGLFQTFTVLRNEVAQFQKWAWDMHTELL